jgi:ankyrin repeat protein
MLLEAGANPNHCEQPYSSPLYVAQTEGLHEIQKMLLRSGADQIPDLHMALLNDRKRDAHTLISSGAKVNIEGPGGYTPLMIAAGKGFLPLTKKLIQHGARVDEQNWSGNSALHQAVMNDQTDVASYLIAAGADPSITNNQGMSPAMIKLKQERHSCLSRRSLLSLGNDHQIR